MHNSVRGYGSVILVMLIWGSVGIFGRYADQEAAVIVFYRVVSACLFLFLLLLLQKRLGAAWHSIRGQQGLVAISGIVLALNWIFFFQAVELTTVANAVLAYYMAPVIVTVLAPFFLKERLERSTMIAVLLALCGTVLMHPGWQFSDGDLLGIGSGLAAAVFYAFVTITGKKVQNVEPVPLVFWQTLVAAVILLPYLLWQGISAPGIQSLGVMATIGIVHTALALSLYFSGLREVKVQHVGVLGYLDPVSAIVFALLFLGEVPGWQTLAGGSLILAANMLILRQKQNAPLQEASSSRP